MQLERCFITQIKETCGQCRKAAAVGGERGRIIIIIIIVVVVVIIIFILKHNSRDTVCCWGYGW